MPKIFAYPFHKMQALHQAEYIGRDKNKRSLFYFANQARPFLINLADTLLIASCIRH